MKHNNQVTSTTDTTSTLVNTSARVGALVLSHPGDQITLVGPERTPAVFQCLFAGRPWVAHSALTEHARLFNFTW